jgi:hypothetical protein
MRHEPKRSRRISNCRKPVFRKAVFRAGMRLKAASELVPLRVRPAAELLQYPEA